MATIVLTALGDDRPGLVEALSGIVAEHGGSWQRSHMARLGGKFAGLVQIEVADAARHDLVRALEPLHADGLLDVRVEIADPDDRPESPVVRLALDLVGADRPGIVHEISAALAAHGVSITELETTSTSAPMAGDALFEAHAELVVPGDVAADALRRTLEAIANELMVDLDLAPAATTVTPGVEHAG